MSNSSILVARKALQFSGRGIVRETVIPRKTESEPEQLLARLRSALQSSANTADLDKMARFEQDREDLLREATALVERIELTVESMSENVVVGFRRDGCCSWYFGPDCSHQFNTKLELRRAFHNGQLIKAEKHRLVGLRRQRADGEVQLIRDEWTDSQIGEYLELVDQHLNKMQHVLKEGRFEVVGEVPEHGDVVPRIIEWLMMRPDTITIAASAHAK